MAKQITFGQALLILLFIFGMYTLILLYGKKATFTTTATCIFESDTIPWGGRTTVTCTATYKPMVPNETISILLPLPTPNVKSATVSFINVYTPYKEININGSLPPDSTTYETVTIPSEAYNILIYGEIIGKGIDSDYPDFPYIHGGNYPLDCSIDCKYNKGVIIDKPGTYNLEIYSGKGGAGIDYAITGGYYLPYPDVEVYVNNRLVTYIQSLSDWKTIDITQYIDQTPSTVVIKTYGYPNYEVVVKATADCSFYGTDFECKYLKPSDYKGTLVICTSNANITCDIPENVKLFIGLADLPHISDAINITLTIGTKTIELTQPYAEISGPFTAGEYTITVRYYLPYVVSGALTTYGMCAIDKDKLYIVAVPGSTTNTTFTIVNYGTESILVTIYVSDNIQQYVSVYPTQAILEPNKPYTFTVTVRLPQTLPETTIHGEIRIEGCGAEPIVLPVEITTTEKTVQILKTIVLVGTILFIIILLLLIYRLFTKRF